MSAAPTAPKGKIGEASKIAEVTDEELEAQLSKLRS